MDYYYEQYLKKCEKNKIPKDQIKDYETFKKYDLRNFAKKFYFSKIYGYLGICGEGLKP